MTDFSDTLCSSRSLISLNALTLLPHGLYRENPICVDLLRINPWDVDHPDAHAYLIEQLSTYPDRVWDVLREEYDSETQTPDDIFKFGLQAIGVAMDSNNAKALRRAFDNADTVDDGLEVFYHYARHLVQDHVQEPDKILNVVRARTAAHPTLLSQEDYTHHLAFMAKAMEALPEEYERVRARLNLRVVVNPERNSSHFGNRTIYIRQDNFDLNIDQLRNVMLEEIIHGADSFLGFTDQEDWRAAAEKATAHYTSMQEKSTEPPLDMNASVDDIIAHLDDKYRDDPVAHAQALDAAIQKLDESLIHAVSSHTGKMKTAAYDKEKWRIELLPDVFHTIRQFMDEDFSDEEAQQAVEELYGKEVMPLVDKFWTEFQQIAQGTHPLFQPNQDPQNDPGPAPEM